VKRAPANVAFSLLAAAMAWAVALAGCGPLRSSRDVRATILDENGSPLPGAVFYAEAADESGAFAFLAARAGHAGEVPDSAREPLKIAWRSGARIALAAFAPGRRPVVVQSTGERVETDGVVLAFAAATELRERWEPQLVHLAYPFENEPELAALVEGPAYVFLREAFQEAYAPLAEKLASELTPLEAEKLAVVQGRP
jgi:hypothetical protein